MDSLRIDELLNQDWKPAIDVIERSEDHLIKIDMSEVFASDVKILIEGNHLIVRGIRRFATEAKRLIHTERHYGKFYREFKIPCSFDLLRAEAEFGEGVLYIRLPKLKSSDAARTIPVL